MLEKGADMDGTAVAALVVGGVLGVIGTFVFEAFGLKTLAAKLSRKRAQARLVELNIELDRLRELKSQPIALLLLVAGRILLINILWVLQTSVDYILGLVVNSEYATNWARPLGVPSEAISGGVSTGASAVGVILTALIAGIGYRTYVLWRKTQRLESYEEKAEGQMRELSEVALTGR